MVAYLSLSFKRDRRKRRGRRRNKETGETGWLVGRLMRDERKRDAHWLSSNNGGCSDSFYFVDISVVMCLSFHILYNCVNFVVQLWLEWRLPAVGRKVAATTWVANSATISARPVLFFFFAQGDHFRQTKVKHPIILVHPYHTCTTSKYVLISFIRPLQRSHWLLLLGLFYI